MGNLDFQANVMYVADQNNTRIARISYISNAISPIPLGGKDPYALTVHHGKLYYMVESGTIIYA